MSELYKTMPKVTQGLVNTAGAIAESASNAAGKVAANVPSPAAALPGEVVPPSTNASAEAFRSLGQPTSARTPAQWKAIVAQAFQQIGTASSSAASARVPAPGAGSVPIPVPTLPPFLDGNVQTIPDGTNNTINFPEAGGLLSNSLEGLNAQINNLQAKLQNGSISDTELLQLQTLMQRQLQLISAITNILKMQHDAQMAIINNIR